MPIGASFSLFLILCIETLHREYDCVVCCAKYSIHYLLFTYRYVVFIIRAYFRDAVGIYV